MSLIVAGTGHRPNKLGGYGAYNPVRDQLVGKLERRLVELRAQDPDLRVISGMALGFDQWLASSCVSLAIPFTAALPFRGQEKHWPVDSQREYERLITLASVVVVVCPGGYAPWKMQKRNVWMVDHCELMLAAWDGTTGGTANCLIYCREIGRVVENLLERSRS